MDEFRVFFSGYMDCLGSTPNEAAEFVEETLSHSGVHAETTDTVKIKEAS